jgi:hypothetical protein
METYPPNDYRSPFREGSHHVWTFLKLKELAPHFG